MLSFPFNSSSTVMWINRDAFKLAGLNPDAPPKTWPEVFDAAKKLKAGGYANCGFSSAWITQSVFSPAARPRTVRRG
jgi:sn-glycerol 3-phosphate transport system substrate-binding protein